MKTIEQLQSAVDELRSVCEKHGVVLIGTCNTEQIYGEITIAENRVSAVHWLNLDSVLDNKVIADNYGGFSLGGIGELKED